MGGLKFALYGWNKKEIQDVDLETLELLRVPKDARIFYRKD